MAKVASGMGIELDTLLKMLDGKQSVQLVDDNTNSIHITTSIRYQEIIDICEQLSNHNQRKVLTYSKKLLDTQKMEQELLAGSLPQKQFKMLVGQLALHEEKAYSAWNKAVRGEHFDKIKPLQ